MPNAGARVGFQAAEHAGGVYEGERCSVKEKVAEPAACPTPVPGSASRQLGMQGVRRQGGKKGGGPGCMPNAGASVGFQAAEHAGGVYEGERCSGKEK